MNTSRPGGHRRLAPWLAVGLVAATFGGARWWTASPQDAALPPPPPVIEREPAVAAYPDDGLSRYVVTPATAVGSEPGRGPDSDPGGEPGAAGGSQRQRWEITADQWHEIPEGATLDVRDGVPGYVDAGGAFVSLAPGHDQEREREREEPGSPDPAAGDGGFGDPVIDALARLDGVERVTAIGDGSFAVVTSSPDALDGLELDVADDAPFALATDPYEPYQWALDNDGANLDAVGLASPPLQVADADVDGAEAAAGSGGGGVVVAVVDSGVDFGHADLAGQNWVNDGEVCGNGVDDDANGYVDDCTGWDFANEDNQPYAPGSHEHGTHVAGIIAASAGNGIGVAGLAPEVTIMDLAVGGSSGISGSSIARAVRYAVDNGADVVNLSLGSAPGVPIESVAPIVDAVRYAEEQGVLLVAAAGNDGVDLGAAPVYPASVDAVNLLTVGASTPAEAKASFSNYGAAVDVFAPGELILSTMPGGGYAFMSGTSQASPLTAAAAALVLGNQPGASPEVVISQLVGTADEVDAYTGLAADGVRVNAARAIGIEPDGAADAEAGVGVWFGGLVAPVPEQVAAKIELSATGDPFDEPFTWEVSLVAVAATGVFGVTGHPVSVDGELLVTDERGAVSLGDATVSSAELETVVPPGTYGLVVEAVPEADPASRLADGYVATFTVGDPAASPGVEPGGDDPATASSTTQPATTVTSSAPVGGSSPTASSPGPSAGSGGGGGAIGPSTTAGTGPVSTVAPATATTGGASQATTTAPASATPATVRPTTVPPTTVPPTTVPPSTSAPTTASSGSSGPVTTSVVIVTGPTGGTAPVTVGPIATSDGQWAITGMAPRSGLVATSTYVSIIGSFPAPVSVWFGDQPGSVDFQSDSWLLVRTPLRSDPALVDVTLRRSGAVVLSVADAFVFQAAAGDPPVVGPGPTTSGPTGTTTSPTASSTLSPTSTQTTSPTAGTAPGGTSPADTGAGGGGDGPVASLRRQRATALSEPIELGNGLLVTPLSGLGAVRDVATCRSDPCRARSI